MLRVTCAGGLCHHGIHTHIRVHTCKNTPTHPISSSPWQRISKPAGARRGSQVQGWAPSQAPPSPGNAVKAADPQDQGQASPGQEENRMQLGKAAEAELRPRPRGKALGQFVCCPEQKSVFPAQPLRNLGQEDTLWTTGLTLLGDTERQGLGPSGTWSSLCRAGGFSP